MDIKLGILILLNMTLPQKLVLAPDAIFRGNTVFVKLTYVVSQHFCYRNLFAKYEISSGPSGSMFVGCYYLHCTTDNFTKRRTHVLKIF